MTFPYASISLFDCTRIEKPPCKLGQPYATVGYVTLGYLLPPSDDIRKQKKIF